LADEVELIIDGRGVRVEIGTTLLEAAEAVGIEIPRLCYFEPLTANGLCRLCVVEIEGSRGLQAACVTPSPPGAVVHTRSEKVDRARRTILEMLAASVDLSESPELSRMLEEYSSHPDRFPRAERRNPALIDDNPVYIRNYSKCVLCWRCVQVCAEDVQYTYALTFDGRGFHTGIGTFLQKPMPETSCVFCGNCVGVCPTGALEGKREYLLEQGVSPDDLFEATSLGEWGQAGGRSLGS
jgi:NADP-reducing hydrogenase subunit HndD